MSHTLIYPIYFSLITILTLLACLGIQRKHLLTLLLCIETLSLALIILLALWVKKSMIISSLILLAFGAMDASIGLSLLVLMSRTHGTVMVKELNLNKI